MGWGALVWLDSIMGLSLSGLSLWRVSFLFGLADLSGFLLVTFVICCPVIELFQQNIFYHLSVFWRDYGLCDNSILTFRYLIRLRQRLCNCIWSGLSRFLAIIRFSCQLNTNLKPGTVLSVQVSANKRTAAYVTPPIAFPWETINFRNSLPWRPVSHDWMA